MRAWRKEVDCWSNKVASYDGFEMKSLHSNGLLRSNALPNHDRPAYVPVVIIITVTVKKDSP